MPTTVVSPHIEYNFLLVRSPSLKWISLPAWAAFFPNCSQLPMRFRTAAVRLRQPSAGLAAKFS